MKNQFLTQYSGLPVNVFISIVSNILVRLKQNLTAIDRVQLKYDCSDGPRPNGTGQPSPLLICFALHIWTGF